MMITYQTENKKYLPLIYIMMNFEAAAAFALVPYIPTQTHKNFLAREKYLAAKSADSRDFGSRIR